MKTIKIIGFALLTLVVILGIVVSLQPAQAHLEQSIVIDAPPSAIFPQVSQYKKFTVWSPWTKMDPEAVQTYEGTDGTAGAKMFWDGPKTGQGSQWIIEIVDNARVRSGMNFGGMEGEFYSEFILTPEGEGTRVTWTYDGPNNGVMGKALWVIMGSMLSSQYNQGLQDLKDLVENRNK